MSETKNNSGNFTNKTSLRDEDIEAGSNTRHAINIERKDSPSVSPSEMRADIDNWVSSLEGILEHIPQHMCNPQHPGRISRIPENLREVEVKAYEPQFLSIGPYHNGKPRLQQMEKRKRLFLRLVLEKRPEITLDNYLKELKSTEQVARGFYSDVEMDSENFLHMLLLDSMFVLTTFCGLPECKNNLNQPSRRFESVGYNEGTGEGTDQINEGMAMGKQDNNMQKMARETESCNKARSEQNEVPRWFCTLFLHDLFLVENQLPFFVLQKLYVLAYGGCEVDLLNIMKLKISRMLSDYTKIDSETAIALTDEVYHLLHFCHLLFRPILRQDTTDCHLPDSDQMFRLESAVQLYDAGVDFEARSGSVQHCLLDITFSSSGKMVMPCLSVDDNTDSLLRNLVALEQMKYPSLGLDISAYVVFLLHLVTIPEDVELLRRKGIIQHHLASDKEMMCLVNRLSVGLSFDYVEDEYSLKPVFRELKRYTRHRVPRWRAWLQHRYFNNPWMIISLLAASLLLILSAVQTYYAVYSYYRPYLSSQP